MSRKYTVCTGPVMVPTGENEFTLVVPPTEHVAYGKTIKYVAAPDSGQFQVLDMHGSVVFSTPISMLLWFKVDQGLGELATVPLVDIDEPKEET